MLDVCASAVAWYIRHESHYQCEFTKRTKTKSNSLLYFPIVLNKWMNVCRGNKKPKMPFIG